METTNKNEENTKPTKLKLTTELRSEFVCCIIEAFEDFLESKKIVINNPEKDEDEYASNIYGTDYGDLSDLINTIIDKWNLIDRE